MRLDASILHEMFDFTEFLALIGFPRLKGDTFPTALHRVMAQTGFESVDEDAQSESTPFRLQIRCTVAFLVTSSDAALVAEASRHVMLFIETFVDRHKSPREIHSAVPYLCFAANLCDDSRIAAQVLLDDDIGVTLIGHLWTGGNSDRYFLRVSDIRDLRCTTTNATALRLACLRLIHSLSRYRAIDVIFTELLEMIGHATLGHIDWGRICTHQKLYSKDALVDLHDLGMCSCRIQRGML